MVGVPGELSLIFCTKRLLTLVRAGSVVASDATYKITARLVGALQVLILTSFQLGSVSTVITILGGGNEWDVKSKKP